jgi:hypothetical protein
LIDLSMTAIFTATDPVALILGSVSPVGPLAAPNPLPARLALFAFAADDWTSLLTTVTASSPSIAPLCVRVRVRGQGSGLGLGLRLGLRLGVGSPLSVASPNEPMLSRSLSNWIDSAVRTLTFSVVALDSPLPLPPSPLPPSPLPPSPLPASLRRRPSG